MAWNPGFTKLRDLLAELYPNIQLAREVLEQAELPTGHVKFSAAATSNWHEILREADRRKRVPAIVAVARAEYPERGAELTQAEEESLGLVEQLEALDEQPVQPMGASPPLDLVHDLLLAAFTAKELWRLFRYTPNPALNPVVNEFSPNDGPDSMVDKAIIYCEKRGLLPDLLAEVQRENPYQYARFEPLLEAGT